MIHNIYFLSLSSEEISSYKLTFNLGRPNIIVCSFIDGWKRNNDNAKDESWCIIKECSYWSMYKICFCIVLDF